LAPVTKHPTALVQSAKIGSGTRIWAFVNILAGAVIGEDANICDHVFIENDVIIGDRVTIKCGVFLWDGTRIEDDVFVGPNVAFTNDLYPRSKHYKEPGRTVVRRGASIGANATILSNITVGMNAMVGAGAVVTKDVPPNAIVVGNPARIKGYVSGLSSGNGVSPQREHNISSPQPVTEVRGVRIIKMPKVEDLRGCLTYGEVDAHLPFVPMRIFMVYDVPSKDVRGEHAHRRLEQLLVCVRGSCAVVADDGENRGEILLTSSDAALYLPPMVWGTQYKYSEDAVLLVLASHKYDSGDYIRDYDEFLREVRGER
jgi:UDP-2-acetamido-3-amino-2,3-dideoxy-glucuronate N-acetyltransferase